jgi:signal transduction histidine kinase
MPTVPAQKNWFSVAASVWWTGLLLSLAVGLALYVVTARSIEHDARQRFVNQARNAQYALAARVRAYTDVLRSAASFFQAADKVDRASFHRYVSGLNLPQQFAAIDNVNFAQYVTDSQRNRFEQAARASARALDGYPPFAIQPPGRRADYAVVTLIEPVEQFSEKLGMDIAARASVARALAQSRDTGAPASSGQTITLLEQPQRVGLAMRMPVYRKDAALDSVARRRAAYLGSVGIGFSVHRLVQAALDEIAGRNLRLSLYDSGELDEPRPRPADEVLLFDSLPAASAEPTDDLFATTLPVEFGGRQWQARFSGPKAAWRSPVDGYLPYLALATGSVVTLLLYVLFHTLAASRRHAIRMAKAMTRELRDSQARLQQSHDKLRGLAAHADQIKELERKRIAREIHDDLGQNLLVLRIEADLLASRTRQRHPRLHARARTTLGQIDRTIRSVRHIINDLRPAVLDLGLSAAVEWQIEQFRQRSGMVCELVEGEAEIRADDLCATALFRVLQESLSNILQHARASAVRVELRQQDGVLSMTVSDNGVGIVPRLRNKHGSYGLVGIEERIGILGGRCTISGSPAAGTTVTVSVPVGGGPGDGDVSACAGQELTA